MNNTKAHVVYNGMFSLHEAETLFAQRAATVDNTICCGIVGGIDATKGQLEVLRGLHKWKQQSGKNFKLYIVGSADERNKQYAESLHAFVHENNLNGNVTFTGHTDDVDQYYQKMNVLISGSLSEAFGRTIPEAMARGIFVIAHNTGGIPEMVIHKETGLLYNSEDEFVSCMNAYMDKLVDAEMIRQNAFALVTKKFLKEEYAAKIKRLLLN